jgi:transposase
LNRKDDYGPIPLTDAQWAALQKLFPDGVCDFTKPGVDRQDTVPWLTYQDAKGNVVYGGTPLAAAPASRPLRVKRRAR